MRRYILFISTAIFFTSIAITIAVFAFNDSKNIAAYLQPVLPLAFISYWLIFIAFDERKNNSGDVIFVSRNFTSIRGFAFIGKRHVVPFFLILFGTVVLAIAGAFLGANKVTSDFAWILLGVSFIYGTLVTIYFQIRLRASVDLKVQEKEMSKIGTNIAVFFASVATLGLFYLIWRLFLKRILLTDSDNK